jgi:hypothetical protein
VRRIQSSLFALLIVFTARASDKGDPRQKVLDASHSTRINDVDMKPWHLKVNFHLSGRNGQPAEDGSIEEWWAGLATWKLRIESPSYTAAVIENKDGDFRTEGVGPIPLRIRAIERDIVYPMPMGENLSKSVSHTSRQKLEKDTLDCIQLSEPPIPLSFPTFCSIKAVERCVRSSLPIRRCWFAIGLANSPNTPLLCRLNPRKARRLWRRPRSLISPRCSRMTLYSRHHLT